MKVSININIEESDSDYISKNKDNLIYECKEGELYENDNLDWLINNQDKYRNKIKMIYIDPPYNTGNKFIYNDKKSHSGWLAFMYPRLKLAQELLKEDGVIFISIDDNEQANLKILCDEIFGEDNFVTMFLWEKSSSNLSNFYKNNYDYILCYIKDKNKYTNRFIGKISEGMGDSSLLNGNANAYSKLVFPPQSICFKFQENGILNSFKSDDLELHNDVKIIDSYNVNEVVISAHFKWKQDTLTEEITKGSLIISKTDKLRLRYQRDNKGDIIIPYKNITRENNVDLKNNNDVLGFSHAKPVSLLQYLCSMIACKKNDIVLDFFAGSGTTGHAVMQLNAQDGGNRKFILVQLDEDLSQYKKHKKSDKVLGYKRGDFMLDENNNKILADNQSEAYKFCIENNFKPVISSLTKERLIRSRNLLNS